MDSSSLERLQQIALQSKAYQDRFGAPDLPASQIEERLKGLYTWPPVEAQSIVDDVSTEEIKQRLVQIMQQDMGQAPVHEPSTPPKLNRAQRRKQKRLKPKPQRSSPNTLVHQFAVYVRSLSDRQIWNLFHPNDQE